MSAGRNRGKLHLDDAALQADHGGVGPVVGAQFGENVFDPPLNGLFRDRKLVGNLLVGVAGRNQFQNARLPPE